MDLLACLVAGLIGSGQIGQDQSNGMQSRLVLVDYATSHPHLKWDAAAYAAPVIRRSNGTVQAVSCADSQRGQDDEALQRILLLKGVASISRSAYLAVGGSESIERESLKTTIHEQSIGLIRNAEVTDTLLLPTKQSAVVCALISGVVGG